MIQDQWSFGLSLAVQVYALLFFICRHFYRSQSSNRREHDHDSDDEMSDSGNDGYDDGVEKIELGKHHVVKATRKRRNV
jgi:hypothetical protein